MAPVLQWPSVPLPSVSDRGVSVVVPVFSGSDNLERLLTEVEKAAAAGDRPLEVVLVDDSGGDRNWPALQAVASSRPHVTLIRLARNFGQHVALLAGIRAATMPRIVTMDDDLQHPPRELAHLLDRLDADGLDLVYGHPRQSANGPLRHALSYVVRWLMSQHTDARLARSISGYRAFRTDLRRYFVTVSGPVVNLDVLLSWGAARWDQVEVDFDQRTEGRSSYSLARLARHAASMITGFSLWPLRLVAISGALITVVGALALAVLAVLAVVGTGVTAPWVLAALMVTCTGAVLVGVGTVGEYVGNIHMRLQRPEPYLVAENRSRVESDGDDA